MPKYCSICLGEYKDRVEYCPKDNAKLTNKKPKAYERLVDIYAASDEIEAERIITFLRDEGIVTTESVAGISQLPVASDTRFIIAVLKDDLAQAKKLLNEARQDGIISENGTFL